MAFRARSGATSARLCMLANRVLEIIAEHHGDTWRTVYTVRYAEAIYVLHAFQKKSKRGIATPKKDMDLIHQRLAEAERLHRERQN